MLQNTPFIFLTARAEKDDIRKGMVLGADDYLSKPFDGTDLLNAVESRLRKRELIKREFSSGLEGLNDLIRVNRKDNLESFISDRNINVYKKKQLIYSEGNRPSKLYYIVKGKVKTYKVNQDGKELIIGLSNEGDFLGYVALLNECPYNEVAEALEESELALIPKEDFEELMNANRDVARKFIGMLAKNITSIEVQLLKMAYDSLRKKVADTLLVLNKKYNKTIDISRDNLATMAGTATESLIRTLGDFKSEKLIEIKEGSIIILNIKKLGEMAN